MAQEQAALKQEDSMEDILHSIRDIIADESKETSTDDEFSAIPADIAEDDDILELTEVVEDGAAMQSVAAQKDVLDDIDAMLSDDEAANQITASNPPVIQQEEPKQAPVIVEKPIHKAVSEPVADVAASNLLSQNVASAASQSLKGLIDSVPKPDVDSPQFRGGHTLEDLVVETMKPMLAEWLNANLPVIVSDLVEKEIRRLVPRE
jgi:uncharacterized protein